MDYEMLVHILVAVALRVDDETADDEGGFLGWRRVAIAVRAGTLPDNVFPDKRINAHLILQPIRCS